MQLRRVLASALLLAFLATSTNAIIALGYALPSGITVPDNGPSGFAASAYTGDLDGTVLAVTFDPATSDLYSVTSTGQIWKTLPTVDATSGSAAVALGTPLDKNPSGLAWARAGQGSHLYVARKGTAPDYFDGDVVEVDATTGAIVRTVAQPQVLELWNTVGIDWEPCPTGLATDPANGDLVFTDSCGTMSVHYIFRVKNVESGTPFIQWPAVVVSNGRPTHAVSVTPGGTLLATDALGGMHSAGAGQSPTSQLATSLGAKGITYVGITVSAGTEIPIFTYVTTASGQILKVPTSINGAAKVVVDGASAGGFTIIGNDNCLYATQSSRVLRVSKGDGTCDLFTAGTDLALTMTRTYPAGGINPTVVEETATYKVTLAGIPTGINQGQLSATVSTQAGSVNTVSDVPAGFVNFNPGTGTTGGTAEFNFSYSGTTPGDDMLVATATISGIGSLSSGSVPTTWQAQLDLSKPTIIATVTGTRMNDGVVNTAPCTAQVGAAFPTLQCGWYVSEAEISWDVSAPAGIHSTSPNFGSSNECRSNDDFVGGTRPVPQSGIAFSCTGFTNAQQAGQRINDTGTALINAAIKEPTVVPTAITADGQPYASGTPTNQNVMVTFTCDAAYAPPFYRCGSTPGLQTSYQVPVTTEGTTDLTGTILELPGSPGRSASAPFQVVIDRTIPSISGSASTPGGAYAPDTWTNESVTVTFACTDNTGGSDIASCVADGESGPAKAFASDGLYQNVPGTATDNAGNEATAIYAGPIKIDKTAPVTVATTPTPNGVGEFAVEAEVSLAATDGAISSGVASITYSATGAHPISATTVNASAGALLIDTVGTTVISYLATDAAGNVETVKTLSITIAAPLPTTIAVVDVTVSYDGDPHPTTATVSATDGFTAPVTNLVYAPQGGGAPLAGAPVNSGVYTVTATFAGDAAHLPSTGTGTVTINKVTPVVAYTGLTTFPYGSPFGLAQQSATSTFGGSPVPGTFTYDIAGPLNAGTHTLTVTFTPTDGTNYNAVTTTVTITVTKVTPTITWGSIASITFGTPLGATQLNAVVTVNGSPIAGTFTYTPSSGTLLPAGENHPLGVSFMPTDTTNYNGPVAATNTITVSGLPTIVSVADLTVTYSGSPNPTTATVNGAGGFSQPITNIVYTPQAGGPALAGAPVNAGVYTATATFAGDATHLGSTATGKVTVLKATPTITWANPANIVYGTALGPTQLNAVGSVPGTLTYIPPGTLVPGAGTHTLNVTLAPTDSQNWNTATAAVTLVVDKAPSTTGAPDLTATYNGLAHPIGGTTVMSNATSLDASSVVVGYTPQGGAAPLPGAPIVAGVYDVTLTFPGDENYLPSSGTATITIDKVTPVITWPSPASIAYGTPLTATQLNAVASAPGFPSVPGTYSYGPASGTTLNAGTHTLTVTFTPTDGANFEGPITFTTTITVTKLTPVLNWANPADIIEGTALTGTQLNATATYGGNAVAGTFTYTPAGATLLPVGNGQVLSVTFVPTDTTNYNTPAPKTVLINVLPNIVTPVIEWSNPAAIVYGTPLSGAQLNAVVLYDGVPVAGTLTYGPADGTVLNAGTHSLTVTFMPNDLTRYAIPAPKTVIIVVTKVTPVIEWSNPANITQGTALGATQLDAVAKHNGNVVAGVYSYAPASGTVLPAGNNQNLNVTFVPTDTTNYNTPAPKTVQINVIANPCPSSPAARISNYSFKINNGSSVSSLSGRVDEGDNVKATFSIAAGCSDVQVSLVSYQAPEPTYDRDDAHLQTVHDQATGYFDAGTHSIDVDVPSCFFQVDFVRGAVIQQLGPANTNNFYGDQNRLLSYDNDGEHMCAAFGTGTNFVIWGGEKSTISASVKNGDHVNFWGSQWAKQVGKKDYHEDDYNAHNDFKGWGGVLTGSGSSTKWTTKPGQSTQPDSVGAYITVLITTDTDKDGKWDKGNVKAYAVLRVDDGGANTSSPGKRGWGTVISVYYP